MTAAITNMEMTEHETDGEQPSEILPDDLRHTAVHEAGHAVLARVLGLFGGMVTIKPDYDEGTAGFAITPDPWLIMDRWDRAGRFREHSSILRGRILAYMAGRFAEEEILGWCNDGDGDDQYQAGCMIDDLGVPQRSDDSEADWRYFVGRLRRHSRALVVRHREEIERLAAALLERTTLSQEEADAIVFGHARGFASDLSDT